MEKTETTIEQATRIINERLADYPTVNVYGSWHCGPPVWSRNDINIDDGYADPKPDYEPYCARFSTIAAELRSLGHIVDDRGTSLTVCRRGSDQALAAAIAQDIRAGISAGDIVILNHNLGVECIRVISADAEFLRFEKHNPMTRGWVCDVLRTDLLPAFFKMDGCVHWVEIIDENEHKCWQRLSGCRCLSEAFRELASAGQERRFKLAAYDGWGDDGGPGKKLAVLGSFSVRRVGMQVFVERTQNA